MQPGRREGKNVEDGGLDPLGDQHPEEGAVRSLAEDHLHAGAAALGFW